MSSLIHVKEEADKDFQLVRPIPPSSHGFYSSGQINAAGAATLTVQTGEILTFPRQTLIAQAIQFLRAELGSVSDVEEILYRIEETDRGPGFILDFLVVIPEADRDLKRSILSALANLMREYSYLLFDFRIVKRKGRERDAVIPEGYTR